MPNRQLQCDSVCNFYIVQQYPSIYIVFIMFAACKHICGGWGERESVNLTSSLLDLLSLNPFHCNHEARELCVLLLLSKGSV